MSGFKDIAKGGWHPKSKDGKSRESWRSDFKGINQVAGWMGKGKAPSAEANEHVSRPLSALKDPSAFGPPPKNVNYYGGAALPNQTTPDTRGLDPPLSQDQILAKQQAEKDGRNEEEEAAGPKPPPVPYRVNTTGLSTSHLPPPPGRKDGADGRNPAADVKPKPPGLPPRLPPRQISNHTPSPPPTYGAATAEPDAHKGILNQGSLNRLGASGVSVPGFGIGGTQGTQLNELQSRFSRLSSSTSPKLELPTEGTTLAQKQAALRTASNFRNDPSSVSLSDAKTAASTANNFRERHGEQVKSGWQSVNKLNTKYGITDKVGSHRGIVHSQTSEPASPQIEMRDNTIGSPVASGTVEGGALGKKKPPPPPVKRVELTASGISKQAGAPPVPVSSKPKPQVSNHFE
jgi:hypothetical protein